ncbi:MAG: hypothetical protein ACD_38C00167G0006 [uncultured bacterium]|uniref:Uncharacterized protein n=1 Tax=Candidatus Daviesbacteria bacterium GW2011_GWC2_40_12 TaxID=1618431 RepID=A0A0G0QWZ2_9BACT|nr:MAG: hypothetical protein ACD_38C00167G0006 [uncultured bacterium]KKR16147.1 MAG: hypothetical protein UT45_C0008G0022 [Candidatus Daviesbacteria bacterium GW2011_GWA2_39_33]KKR41926.1 MAG: hypothetical protein UT77_C0005G0041 [Candidatus Daviesbacteria bacterium GW2011_GWC2_40_12]
MGDDIKDKAEETKEDIKDAAEDTKDKVTSE